MEILEKPIEVDYNKNLLKTVAVLYSLHNELLAQLANLVKYSETDETDKYITDSQITNLISSKSISSIDSNAQDLIELIELMKEKMNILLNRTLQQTM
ncbi:hypothetical protein [Albibacterium bauzanense]|uniref:Uncharacterized protein n=1 Tax=Albibacterium bauzanense TaxID=653929 RepID=A0A4R1LNI3_9SPHI|nr:hypothetical protein [Albibacterium bauzanense]TCK80598.1 hypothetical protein C8N28_2340 [Albibacterium bauzanense]